MARIAGAARIARDRGAAAKRPTIAGGYGMTALFRLFIWLVVLGGITVGSMLAVTFLVEPTPREIVIEVPPSKFHKP